MMLAPMFTMRLIAEERRSQTLTLLLSAPLSSHTSCSASSSAC
jgi:ABC-type Na+ efflux pump permease subunit